jgi:ubiquinone/menaquinone biosynthesis C-methylase UbiE
MSTLFWTGKISLPLRLLINLGSILAWITGYARKPSAMKERVKEGYNGKFSDFISKYDDLASNHYKKIAGALMNYVDCKGKKVVDIGCGTGILSFMALENEAAQVRGVDPSQYMLDQCRKKSISKGYSEEIISFYEGDAQNIPFQDATFDVVLSNMVLGMIPDQQAAIKEFTRVLRPGGILALTTHGPAHYLEAIEAGVKSMNLRYYYNHRFEFWPRNEKKLKRYFKNAGLQQINTERLIWRDEYENGGEVFDFFASTTGLWFYHRLPPSLRQKEEEKTRIYFQRKQISGITSDVVIAFGEKQ